MIGSYVDPVDAVIKARIADDRKMSGIKRLKDLSIAVYGNVIVPILIFDIDDWFQILEDAEAGLCRIECRRRKP